MHRTISIRSYDGGLRKWNRKQHHPDTHFPLSVSMPKNPRKYWKIIKSLKKPRVSSKLTWRIGFICGNLSRVHEAARAFHTGQDRQRHALHRIRCHCRFGHLFRIHDVNTQILQDPARRMLSSTGHALSDASRTSGVVNPFLWPALYL